MKITLKLAFFSSIFISESRSDLYGSKKKDSDDLKFFGCVWVSGERKHFFFEKKMHFSGFPDQNRSGEMAILGRIFHFFTINTKKSIYSGTLCAQEKKSYLRHLST